MSRSPGLSAKLSFYGLYLYNEGAVRLWPYPRANGEHTIDVLRRLRADYPDRKLIVVWDGAPYHRANSVRNAAAALDIELVPLPGYSPDFMPVEALWRWLREDVTDQHCHALSCPVMPALTTWSAAWTPSKPTSIMTRSPSPTASGSRINSIRTKRNYASQARRGLENAFHVVKEADRDNPAWGRGT